MFLLHVWGKGEGCDYTIGCNHALSILKDAETMEEAEQAAKEWLADHGIGEDYYTKDEDNYEEYYEDEVDIDSIDLYEVKSHKGFELDKYIKEINAFRHKNKNKKNETKEAAEYARLKKKFEEK